MNVNIKMTISSIEQTSWWSVFYEAWVFDSVRIARGTVEGDQRNHLIDVALGHINEAVKDRAAYQFDDAEGA